MGEKKGKEWMGVQKSGEDEGFGRGHNKIEQNEGSPETTTPYLNGFSNMIILIGI